jgi:hypothetical protein
MSHNLDPTPVATKGYVLVGTNNGFGMKTPHESPCQSHVSMDQTRSGSGGRNRYRWRPRKLLVLGGCIPYNLVLVRNRKIQSMHHPHDRGQPPPSINRATTIFHVRHRWCAPWHRYASNAPNWVSRHNAPPRAWSAARRKTWNSEHPCRWGRPGHHGLTYLINVSFELDAK